VTTLELENIFLIADRKYDQAVKNLNIIKVCSAKNREIYKYALYDLGCIYYNLLDDRTRGKEYFDELKVKYPEDELSWSSMVLLEETDSNAMPPDLPPKNENALNISSLPTKFNLLGNYPNPFNPMTTIKYALPYQSVVEIIIYDIMGRKVKSFTISSQSPGYQGIVWNGTNENERQVSSGLYFYRINIKSLENDIVFVKTSKMMFLK
jgi:hypothetical protein